MLTPLSTGSSQYMQSDTGSIYYSATDYTYNNLSGVNVTFIITDPNGTLVYNESYTTDSYGKILPQPRFSLASDAVLGNYTLTSYSYYYDENASRNVNTTNQTHFEVLREIAVSEGLMADVATTVVWYPESTMTFAINIYDSAYNPVAPDEMNLTIYVGSPLLNNVYLFVNLTDPLMHEIEPGYYIVSYVMPSNTSSGDYWAVVHASKDNLYTISRTPFRVATGGPYDVRINLLENEVPRGDYLDFEIVIENMGEFGQDVDVYYWVSDSTQSFYHASEAVYTPPNTNVTLSRTAFIYTYQTPGIHYLNVRVNYSTIQPVITKNVTFVVTEAAPYVPPEEAGGPPGERAAAVTPPERKARIEIIEYPEELPVEVGFAKFPSIKVKNTGEKSLHNVSLYVTGIHVDWYDIDPKIIDVLPVNETVVFTMKILVPPGAKSGDRVVKLTAGSDEAKDEKTFSLLIFASRKELVEYELARLKARLEQLEIRISEVEKEREVSDVLKLVEEVKKQIRLAEDYLSQERYDSALNAIYVGFNVLERAEYLLKIAPLKPPVMPAWIIALIVIFTAVTIILVIIIKKQGAYLKMLLKVRVPRVWLAKHLSASKESEKESLMHEKEKTQRVLKLLESQYKEGIISKEAYLAIKRRTEDRLKKTKEKLKQLSPKERQKP